MKKVLERGFTLIELLVVIAIIGILAAVVLASLNDARDRGSDASIQQSLSNARSQAEIVYNTAGAFSYENVCEDSKITTLVDGATANGNDADGSADFTDATAAAWNVAICHDDADDWVIAVPLTDSSAASSSLWCVDGTGFAGRDDAVAASAYACN